MNSSSGKNFRSGWFAHNYKFFVQAKKSTASSAQAVIFDRHLHFGTKFCAKKPVFPEHLKWIIHLASIFLTECFIHLPKNVLYRRYGNASMCVFKLVSGIRVKTSNLTPTVQFKIAGFYLVDLNVNDIS